MREACHYGTHTEPVTEEHAVAATDSPQKPDIAGFYHGPTSSCCFVVGDPATGACAIIDSVLDFDPVSARTVTDFADSLVDHVRAQRLRVDWILETHIHADHLSAAPYLKDVLGGQVAIGDHIGEVQEAFCDIFNVEDGFRADGSQFDRLLKDGERFAVGAVEALAMRTPGHTPACMSYRIGDAVFVGDTLFMPDYGTARCDFPGGSAREIYRSIRRLLALPPDTRIFVGHDYAPGGRPVAWETTVAQQRAANKHVRDGIDEASFVKMRTDRDAELDLPALILPAIQVNMRAGQLPPTEDNGVRYIKIPLNTF